MLDLPRCLLAVAAVVFSLQGVAQTADTYPNKPIRVVVPVVAGGNMDLTVRQLMQGVSTDLGQPIVVENRPGASLLVGTQYVAKSPPDGYTLLAMSNTFVTAPSLIAESGYDPIKDFTGVGMMSVVPLVVVVGPNSPIRTMADLVAVAKSKPESISYGSAGSGSSPHFAAAMLFLQMGANVLHVPYKGAAAALVDVMGERLTLMIDTLNTSLPHIKSGKLHALAVTSAERSPALPNVPTVAESGFPGYATGAWLGIAAPTGTPAAAVDRFSAAMAKAMTPELREQMLASGNELRSMTPRQFTDYIRRETETVARVIKEAKITAN